MQIHLVWVLPTVPHCSPSLFSLSERCSYYAFWGEGMVESVFTREENGLPVFIVFTPLKNVEPSRKTVYTAEALSPPTGSVMHYLFLFHDGLLKNRVFLKRKKCIIYVVFWLILAGIMERIVKNSMYGIIIYSKGNWISDIHIEDWHLLQNFA